MSEKLNYSLTTNATSKALKVVGVFEEKGSKKSSLKSHYPTFLAHETRSFVGEKGKSLFTTAHEGRDAIVFLGLGDLNKFKVEDLRAMMSSFFNRYANEGYSALHLDLESFAKKLSLKDVIMGIVEGFELGRYRFDEFLTRPKKDAVLKTIYLGLKSKDATLKKFLDERLFIAESVNFTRDLVNLPPNELYSITMVEKIVGDVKKNLPKVKVKILDKEKIKKEKMGLFLAVNQGSHYPPRLLHLEYNPAKGTKNTKHISLVGKGLVFDSGGYSLKGGASMIGMKVDMAGAATVYGAFRNAVKLGSPHKISLYLGITDNLVSENAILPDSIVKSRNGKTVEILNTDAEGRLVLADVLDYAMDGKPDCVIDVATLTGACMAALGEACGVMGNNKEFTDTLLQSAHEADELMWPLPIYDHYREKMKSKVADLKNIAGVGQYAGAQTAAAFLENFVSKEVKWAHMDIAGVSDGSDYLSYFPRGYASGRMVRTLSHFLRYGKI